MQSKVEQFSGPLTACRKCGSGAQHLGEATVQRFASHGFNPSALQVRYCPGGKEPEENVTEPLVELMQQIVVSAQDKFRNLLGKRINICAGIMQEHLHVSCVDCKFEWLTETKDAAELPQLAG